MKSRQGILFALILSLILTGCNVSDISVYDPAIILPKQMAYHFETNGISYNGIIHIIDEQTFCKVATTIGEQTSKVFIYSSPHRDFYQTIFPDGTKETIDSMTKGAELYYLYDLNSVIATDKMHGKKIVYTTSRQYTISNNYVVSVDIIENETERLYNYYDFRDYYTPLDISEFDIPEDIIDSIGG